MKEVSLVQRKQVGAYTDKSKNPNRITREIIRELANDSICILHVNNGPLWTAR
jgi:hypothetical protein